MFSQFNQIFLLHLSLFSDLKNIQYCIFSLKNLIPMFISRNLLLSSKCKYILENSQPRLKQKLSSDLSNLPYFIFLARE